MGVFVPFKFLVNTKAEFICRMSYVWVCMCVCVCLFRLITRRMNRLFDIDRFQLDTKRTSHLQSKSNIKHQISYTHNTFSCRFLFIRHFTSSSLLHGFHSSNNYHSFFFSSTIQLISKLLLLSVLIKFFK